MNIETITLIVIAACGTLLLGMAGLIKSMVVWRLERMEKKQDSVDTDIKEIKTDVGKLNVDVEKLKTEHNMNVNYCRYGPEYDKHREDLVIGI